MKFSSIVLWFSLMAFWAGGAHTTAGAMKAHQRLQSPRSQRAFMAPDGVRQRRSVVPALSRCLSPAAVRIFPRLCTHGSAAHGREERTDMGKRRHPRHVPGRAARGSPTKEGDAQLPAGAAIVFCRSGAEAKSNTQAPGHLRVADKMRLRVDAALAADTAAARTEAGGAAKCVTGR